MRHGILLCAGPSLAAYQAQPADLVVAVNRAALTQRCDVWACGDWPFLEDVRAQVTEFQLGRQPALPRLFTAANSHSHLRDHSPRGEWGSPDGKHVDEFESLYDGDENTLQWTGFTATASLWYCLKKGVTHLDVFGADWQGMTYCDGTTISQNRRDSDSVWSWEIAIWTRLVQVASERGMTIARHRPQ